MSLRGWICHREQKALTSLQNGHCVSPTVASMREFFSDLHHKNLAGLLMVSHENVLPTPRLEGFLTQVSLGSVFTNQPIWYMCLWLWQLRFWGARIPYFLLSLQTSSGAFPCDLNFLLDLRSIVDLQNYWSSVWLAFFLIKQDWQIPSFYMLEKKPDSVN